MIIKLNMNSLKSLETPEVFDRIVQKDFKVVYLYTEIRK